jgi:hypothetical protein
VNSLYPSQHYSFKRHLHWAWNYNRPVVAETEAGLRAAGGTLLLLMRRPEYGIYDS